MRYWVRMPIVGMLPDDQRASVIMIPAQETIEMSESITRRGLVEVQWRTSRVRVFTQDIDDCCEPLRGPDVADVSTIS